MKTRPERFAIYIIDNKCTIRECAKKVGLSKSTVHNDLSQKLRKINRFLYVQVYKVLQNNLQVRHIRGGNATKLKYLQLKSEKHL